MTNKEKSMFSDMLGKYVVVTTDKDRKGVFAGYLEKRINETTVILTEARMVVYWPKENRGVVGLAAIGPQSGSRVSYSCPRIEINGVTAIMETTGEAKRNFEEDRWE